MDERGKAAAGQWESIALHDKKEGRKEGRNWRKSAIGTYAVVGRPSTLGRTSMMMKTGSCEQNLRNMEAIFRSFSFTYYVRTRAVAVVEKKTRRGVSEWSSMT